MKVEKANGERGVLRLAEKTLGGIVTIVAVFKLKLILTYPPTGLISGMFLGSDLKPCKTQHGSF